MLLVSIVCIDERSDELAQCLKRLQADPFPKDYLGVFRESDYKCQKLMPNYLTVPDYKIIKRHNIDNMVTKRNLALNYARKHHYDYLLFVDSDILITPILTLALLFEGIKHCDICLSPYPIRWSNGLPTLAYANIDLSLTIEPVRKSSNIYQLCVGGGMGCTMINLKSPKIPTFVYGALMGIEGEDIGFFIEAFKRGCIVLATPNHIVEHINL